MPSTVVSNTTAYPYSAAVSIYVRWANGTTSRGSGTMVGPNDVLTAAHVVYNPSRGAATNITVIAGQNGMNTPFGIYDYGRINYYTIQYQPNGNLTSSTSAHDLAMISLEENLGSRTGTFGLRSNATSTGTRNLISYPSAYQFSFQNLRQVYSSGSTSVTSSNYLNIGNLNVSSGSSGGGIYQILNGSRYVNGVVSTASWGAFLNTSRYNTVLGWMNNNNSLVDTNQVQHFNAGALSSSRGYSGSVNKSTNEVDRYAFHVTTAGTYSFRLQNFNSDADLYVYDVFGRQKGSSLRGGTTTDTVTVNLSAGIYYAEVDQYSSGSNSYNIFMAPGSAAKSSNQIASASTGNKPLSASMTQRHGLGMLAAA